ncbi:unnamed protein product [Echinostoma caproni]|uniref:Reverse transcriptase domain-containing protein n=1 Tax=Echinostoma caproni TaxID=27848 RepID=A0A183AYP2_9TREM|nr:unnamed protein product [Echinostoma caproni]
MSLEIGRLTPSSTASSKRGRVCFLDEVTRSLDGGQKVEVCYMDFKKAFDSVFFANLEDTMLNTLHTFRGTVVPVLGLGLRRISVSQCLWKGNARRPRVAVSGVGSVSEKSRARQDSAREVLAAANRNKWEQSNAKKIELIGKKPSTNVYLASNFEQTGLPFVDALFALREAAQPDMFDCMENPLRAKVSRQLYFRGVFTVHCSS